MKSHTTRRARIRTGACAALLVGVSITLAPSPATSAAPGRTTATSSTSSRAATPPDALAQAQARVDELTGGLSGSVEEQAARLLTFVDEAEVADDKSMQDAGLEARAALDEEIAGLMTEAQGAIPAADSVQPTWASNAANACQQADGEAGTRRGTATCTTNGERDDRAGARAEGDRASATANAVHDGDADARAQGDGSAATARSGAAGRTGQEGNVSDAVSTRGSTTTANAGLGDHDQRNHSTAMADDRSLSSADGNAGDDNEVFAGSSNRGEARVLNTAGDRNRAIALGANGNNDGDGPAGARANTLFGFENNALSVADGQNSAAMTNAGYGDRQRAAANSGANSHARADSAQGEESASFSDAADRGHALAFNSYGDHMLAVARSRGDGSTGQCTPIGLPANSGETTYPVDDCASANARSVDGDTNTAISTVDRAKANSVAERGERNTAVTRATNGGDIVWNTTLPWFGQPANRHAWGRADCPWPLPPPPQSQQPCGNATAKASYGDGNLAVAVPNGDHTFAWSEASGGSYNQTLATADGANSRARSRGTYNNYGTAKSAATDGGNADAFAVMGYENVALANANGRGAVANATAAGPHAEATAAASAGGTVTAVHNTTTTSGSFGGTNLTTGVTCSNDSVTYALIGNGQTCGDGF